MQESRMKEQSHCVRIIKQERDCIVSWSSSVVVVGIQCLSTHEEPSTTTSPEMTRKSSRKRYS